MEERLILTEEWDKVFPESKRLITVRSPFTTVTASRWPPICMRPKTRRENSRPLR